MRRVWDATTGEPDHPALRHRGSCAFAPPSVPMDLSSSSERKRETPHQQYMTPTRAIRRLPLPWRSSSRLFHAAFSPDGGRVVTVAGILGAGMGCRFGCMCAATAAAPGLVTQKASFSPDNRRILTAASFDGKPRAFGTGDGSKSYARPCDIKTRSETLSSVRDGSRLRASVHQTARLWDPIRTYRSVTFDHPNEIYHVSFSPDARRCSRADRMGARIWDLSTGKFLTFKHGRTSSLVRLDAVSSSKCQRQFLVSADSVIIQLGFRCLYGRTNHSTSAHNGPILHAAISPDSPARVGSPRARTGTARIWEDQPSRRSARSHLHSKPDKPSRIQP